MTFFNIQSFDIFFHYDFLTSLQLNISLSKLNLHYCSILRVFVSKSIFYLIFSLPNYTSKFFLLTTFISTFFFIFSNPCLSYFQQNFCLLHHLIFFSFIQLFSYFLIFQNLFTDQFFFFHFLSPQPKFSHSNNPSSLYLSPPIFF